MIANGIEVIRIYWLEKNPSNDQILIIKRHQEMGVKVHVVFAHTLTEDTSNEKNFMIIDELLIIIPEYSIAKDQDGFKGIWYIENRNDIKQKISYFEQLKRYSEVIKENLDFLKLLEK
jgi:hypothetical protein